MEILLEGVDHCVVCYCGKSLIGSEGVAKQNSHSNCLLAWRILDENVKIMCFIFIFDHEFKGHTDKSDKSPPERARRQDLVGNA